MTLLLVGLSVLLFNIPFGYWRAQVKKFSLQWFLAIHIPIPFIITARYVFEIGFAWHTYVVMVSAFFIGQRIGYYIQKTKAKKLATVEVEKLK